MKPLLQFLIGVSIFMSCSGIKKYTIFGYPNIINDDYCEVFVDRNGIFYPNVQLDKELINKNGRQLCLPLLYLEFSFQSSNFRLSFLLPIEVG